MICSSPYSLVLLPIILHSDKLHGEMAGTVQGEQVIASSGPNVAVDDKADFQDAELNAKKRTSAVAC